MKNNKLYKAFVISLIIWAFVVASLVAILYAPPFMVRLIIVLAGFNVSFFILRFVARWF